MDLVSADTPEIHLIRHGHHPDGFRGGWSHRSLTRLGEIQASLLSERLRREGLKVDTLISSDLPRAAQTAEILSQALGVGLSLAEEWREVNNGVRAGMPEEQARAMYPGLYWSSLEPDQPYPGGESPATFYRRIEAAFRDLCDGMLRGHIGPKVLLVMHVGPIGVILSTVRKETQEHWDGKRVLFVAETGGEIVGTVQFVPTHAEDFLADGKTTAYLEALEVKEEFRKRRLGTWLINSVERMAVQRGFRRLTLMVEPDNEPALSLYRKQGFAVFRDYTEIWRGKPHYLLCMEKQLSGGHDCPGHVELMSMTT